jgi:uncharacterized protein
MTTADGEYGLNYLCDGYHAFFSHVRDAMDYMRIQLEKGLPPANVMRWINQR